MALLSNIQFAWKVFVSARRSSDGMTDPVDRVTATTPVGGMVILTIRFPCLRSFILGVSYDTLNLRRDETRGRGRMATDGREAGYVTTQAVG